jgi:hypothetical protein
MTSRSPSCGHPHREVTQDAMKPIVQCFVLVVLAVAMLTGCTAVAPADRATQQIDAKRVAQIEASARREGIEVHWMNYPRKTDQ